MYFVGYISASVSDFLPYSADISRVPVCNSKYTGEYFNRAKMLAFEHWLCWMNKEVILSVFNNIIIYYRFPQPRVDL